MAKTRSFQKDLVQSLKVRSEAQEYLNAALEDGEPEVFLLALRDVAEAQLGGMSKLASASGLNRESLYRMLSKKGNPELASLKTLLESLGFRLSVEPIRKVS